MEIRTERLRLRPFAAADLPAYAALNGDAEVMRWLGGPRGTGETQAEMEHNNRTLAGDGYGKVAVERLGDGALLGMCGLSVEPWYPDDLEIGWRLARAHWGQGYATEAARAWLGHAFAGLGVARVISVSDVPNLRSLRVMERLGMQLDHEAELEIDGDRFAALVYAIDATAHAASTRPG